MKVQMIVLDENLKSTGERKKFGSQGKAAIAIGKPRENISQILSPKHNNKTILDKKTGNTVTFVRADATEEEILEWLKEIENKQDNKPVKVKMIVLDENLKPTGEYKEFESQNKAEVAIGPIYSKVCNILNPDRSLKTITDKKTGNTVTFVRADATEEEEKKWLFEVENKESQPIKIKVVYVDSEKVEYFDSAKKARRATGIDPTTITNDIEKKFINPRKRYHKDTGEEIEFYEA